MNKQKHCWYNLKINTTNCFLEGYQLPEPNGGHGIWSLRAQDLFRPQWLEYMKSIGVFISSAMIFYKGPYTNFPYAHIDIRSVEPLRLSTFGINWCFGGKNSEMVWYEAPTAPKDVSYTQANTPFLSWNINELKEIERTHIGNEASLVRTDVPHCIDMHTDPRWSISARCVEWEGNDWETIIEELRKKNLLIER